MVASASTRLSAFYPPGMSKTPQERGGGMLVRQLHHQQTSLSDMQ